MRSIGTFVLILSMAAALAAMPALQAQDADEAEAAEEDDFDTAAETFAPTEDVAADTAVAFPTDI